MAAPWSLIIPAAGNLLMSYMNKPSKSDYDIDVPETDTRYAERYMANLRGRAQSGEVYRGAMQPQKRQIGQQGRKMQKQVGYDVARMGMEDSGIEAQYRLSAQQQTSEALQRASEGAMAQQISESRRLGEKADEVQMQIGQSKAEHRQRVEAAKLQSEQAYKTAKGKWQTGMWQSAIQSAASIGMDYMQQAQSFKDATALLGDDLVKKLTDEGFSQAQIANIAGNQKLMEVTTNPALQSIFDAQKAATPTTPVTTTTTPTTPVTTTTPGGGTPSPDWHYSEQAEISDLNDDVAIYKTKEEQDADAHYKDKYTKEKKDKKQESLTKIVETKKINEKEVKAKIQKQVGEDATIEKVYPGDGYTTTEHIDARDELEVESKFFDSRGDIGWHGYYDNDMEQHGSGDKAWTEYYSEWDIIREEGDSKGDEPIVKSTTPYKHGKKHGREELFFATGGSQKKEEIRWKEGKKHGISRTWNVVGGFDELTTYEDGAKTGLYQKYSGNGKVKSDANKVIEEGYYSNGNKVGYWLYYDENGKFQKSKNHGGLDEYNKKFDWSSWKVRSKFYTGKASQIGPK